MKFENKYKKVIYLRNVQAYDFFKVFRLQAFDIFGRIYIGAVLCHFKVQVG